MRTFCLRIARVLLGLFLYALGTYIGIQANIGLGAWEAFGVGLSGVTGLSYGDIIACSGLVILVLDVLLGEKIGIGTILNTFLIGKMVDVFNALHLIPKLQNFGAGIALLLLGQTIICLGVFFYAGAGLGAGPRDSLMVAVGKRMPNVPIGVVRGFVEGGALVVGWIFGAKVGVGTVIAIFGISLIMQATFAALRFDVKAVRHESLLQSIKLMSPKLQ